MRSFPEVVKTVERQFCLNRVLSFCSSCSIWIAGTGQYPDSLRLPEEKEGLTWVNDSVSFVVSFYYSVISSSDYVADFELWTIGFGWWPNFKYLASRELGVFNLDYTVAFLGVVCLDAFTILEQNIFVPDLFMPCIRILRDVKVLLELRFRAGSKACLGIDHL